LTFRRAGVSSANNDSTGVIDVDGGVGSMAAADDAPGNAAPHLWHDGAERSLMASHA
jgi:hypothetical protein